MCGVTPIKTMMPSTRTLSLVYDWCNVLCLVKISRLDTSFLKYCQGQDAIYEQN